MTSKLELQELRNGVGTYWEKSSPVTSVSSTSGQIDIVPGTFRVVDIDYLGVAVEVVNKNFPDEKVYILVRNIVGISTEGDQP